MEKKIFQSPKALPSARKRNGKAGVITIVNSKNGGSDSPVYVKGYRLRLRDYEKQETKFVPADTEHMEQLKLSGINPFEKSQQ